MVMETIKFYDLKDNTVNYQSALRKSFANCVNLPSICHSPCAAFLLMKVVNSNKSYVFVFMSQNLKIVYKSKAFLRNIRFEFFKKGCAYQGSFPLQTSSKSKPAIILRDYTNTFERLANCIIPHFFH